MNKQQWIQTLHNVEHTVLIRVTAVGHCIYYILVSMEAHGHYRYVAGALGIVAFSELCIKKLDNAKHN